mgnify:CR=1 FL=1
MSVHLILNSLVLFHYSLLVYFTKKRREFNIKKGSLQNENIAARVKGNVAIWKRQNSFFMRVKGSSSEINQMPKNSHYHILQFWWLHKQHKTLVVESERKKSRDRKKKVTKGKYKIKSEKINLVWKYIRKKSV